MFFPFREKDTVFENYIYVLPFSVLCLRGRQVKVVNEEGANIFFCLVVLSRRRKEIQANRAENVPLTSPWLPLPSGAQKIDLHPFKLACVTPIPRRGKGGRVFCGFD